MLALLVLTFVMAGCVKEKEAIECDAGEMPAGGGGCPGPNPAPESPHTLLRVVERALRRAYAASPMTLEGSPYQSY